MTCSIVLVGNVKGGKLLSVGWRRRHPCAYAVVGTNVFCQLPRRHLHNTCWWLNAVLDVCSNGFSRFRASAYQRETGNGTCSLTSCTNNAGGGGRVMSFTKYTAPSTVSNMTIHSGSIRLKSWPSETATQASFIDPKLRPGDTAKRARTRLWAAVDVGEPPEHRCCFRVDAVPVPRVLGPLAVPPVGAGSSGPSRNLATRHVAIRSSYFLALDAGATGAHNHVQPTTSTK